MSCIVFCFMYFCLVYSHRTLVVVLEGGVVRPLDTPLLAVLDLLPASKRTLREVLVEAVVNVIEQRLADARVGNTRHHDEVGGVPLALDTGGVDDHSFNASAWAGAQASDKFTKTKATYLPAASTARTRSAVTLTLPTG